MRHFSVTPSLRLPVSLALALLLVPHPVAQAADPGAAGPHAVSRDEYNYGDAAFTPTDFPGPVELRASVHYPTNLSGGPFPLVMFLHGRHRTCFDGTNAFLEWPCTPPRWPIHSYQGLEYISAILASHGYIVVSISANGIAARDAMTPDFGALARAELIQEHLAIWNTFNDIGVAPFGSRFLGKVDLADVGLMGHSAGGEGAARHFFLNMSQGLPYGIRALFLIAPADYLRLALSDVPLGLLLSYCDGIATSLPGVHFFDDARYSAPGDSAGKHSVLVMGANHNYYNTVWTPPSTLAPAADDWSAFVSGGSSDPHCGTVSGNQRLTAEAQRGTAVAYVAGFFRIHLGGETAFLPLLKGDAPPPLSAMTDAIHVSYHPPDQPALRRDVNRLLTATNLVTNSLGGASYQTGLTPYDLCGGDPPEPEHCLPAQATTRQPHTAPSALSSAPGLSQLRAGWNGAGAAYVNELPAGSRDVSGFRVLQFRVGVNFADSRNLAGQPQDFSVHLVDGAGARASALVSDWSAALYYPPGAVGPVPKILLNTVRIPLTAFPGVNLADITSVQFVLDQRPSGSFLISDLAFADQAIPGEVPVALSHTFSCGTAGFVYTSIGISARGTVQKFESPAEHLHVSPSRSGYQVCYATSPAGPFSTAFDLGGVLSGWTSTIMTSQPNGPGTFPLEITSETSDGRLRVTRRFTGNSFVAGVPPFNGLDLNGDQQACSTMAECGNCSNRTLHVLTRVTNLAGSALYGVTVNELVDVDIDGTPENDRFIRTGDSIFAYEDMSDGGAGRDGMLLQGLIMSATSAVLPAGTYSPPADCALTSTGTPTGPGNYEAILQQTFGTLAPGANTGSTIRAHYRRF